ncbi:MAG: type IV pilus assembly protein PilM [Verrucomicrobia bacterium]|nr:type IV pilus assembly protein PilM [Verrucomicrobiota bacterium]
MLNKKSFLVVDFGATNLKLAEFELTEAGGLSLRQYGFKSLGQDGTQEATREAAMLKGLQEALAEKSYNARNVNICAPGYHTFSKFVKLPPVDTSKVTQIIQYEAQQNVPFPLEEVVWDYQILGAAPSGELEVLLVAIKSDIVEGLFKTAEKAGLRLQLVDVSPAALCNSFRYNYGDLEGCTMLLDIGAKTSNLLFFEKGNVYSRGINIGANAITQDFAKESKLGYEEAERLKIEEGFVSLGGAYEEPENPHQAAISKIARQVLTRLHIQVNQTIQFYRGQQGGSPPDRLFLSGGATSMPYTAQFFSEKLNLPVEYFNPLRNLQIDDSLPREELAKVAHSLGETVGLGLRNLAHCPVELNLMPKSSLKRQEFNQKKPYLVASVFCLILVVFAFGWFYERVADEKQKALDQLKPTVDQLKRDDQKTKDGVASLKKIQGEADLYFEWMEERVFWSSLLTTFRSSLMAVEEKKEKEFNTKTGVWIERLTPIVPQGYLMSAAQPGASMLAISPSTLPPAPTGAAPPRGGRGVPSKGGSVAGGGTNQIDTILLTCRSVNLTSIKSDANTVLAEALAEELRSRTNQFVADGTKIAGDIAGGDVTNLTFTFQLMVKLAKPVNLSQ